MSYRTALVTGASSGIGRALALAMGKAGVEVAVAARRTAELELVAREIEGGGGRARVYSLDVTDPEHTREVLCQADDDLGGIDLVVANAGVFKSRWSGKLSWEDCAPTIAVNVTGVVATLTALLPRMTERRAGHLVGMSSLAQYRGLPRYAAYCGSKAFVSHFLESLRVDLRSVGIAVTDVRPGYVRTALNAGMEQNLPLLMEVDQAAELIWKGIQRRRKTVEFPWGLAAVLRSSQVAPAAVYETMVSKLLA